MTASNRSAGSGESTLRFPGIRSAGLSSSLTGKTLPPNGLTRHILAKRLLTGKVTLLSTECITTQLIDQPVTDALS
jgi:hypothetical protein